MEHAVGAEGVDRGAVGGGGDADGALAAELPRVDSRLVLVVDEHAGDLEVGVPDRLAQGPHPDVAGAPLHDPQLRLCHVAPPAYAGVQRDNALTLKENAISERDRRLVMDIAEFRAGLGAWLDAHADELAPPYRAAGHARRARRADAAGEGDPVRRPGWMRCGWPERVGGLGGSPMLRTELGAQLVGPRPRRPRPLLADRGARADAHRLRAARARRRRRPPAAVGRGDVVPGVLGARHRQRPRARSRCRAVPDGEPETAATWVINGQKVWTSLAQYSDRCVLLTRTGPTESRHRGITAFFVDMDTPGHHRRAASR